MRGTTTRSWRTSKSAPSEIRKITEELIMEKPVVVLYDNVANAYKDPFYPPTRGVALREFQDAVNNPQNGQLFNHASDFDLYVIGLWDEQTGIMSVFDKAEKLANCASLKTEIA
ncbi:nonstructural protein, partial [Microviridae sp.]